MFSIDLNKKPKVNIPCVKTYADDVERYVVDVYLEWPKYKYTIEGMHRPTKPTMNELYFNHQMKGGKRCKPSNTAVRLAERIIASPSRFKVAFFVDGKIQRKEPDERAFRDPETLVIVHDTNKELRYMQQANTAQHGVGSEQSIVDYEFVYSALEFIAKYKAARARHVSSLRANRLRQERFKEIADIRDALIETIGLSTDKVVVDW